MEHFAFPCSSLLCHAKAEGGEGRNKHPAGNGLGHGLLCGCMQSCRGAGEVGAGAGSHPRYLGCTGVVLPAEGRQ